MTTVVTFSTNISAGHKRAAEAVACAVIAESPAARIIERDAMTLMGRTRRKFLTDAYLGIIRYRPDFWNYLYQKKSISAGINKLGRIFMARINEAFEAEIEAHRPDVIICTQAIPARILGDLKVRGRCSPPLLAVATDYGIHPYWAHPAIDAYAVPCEEAARELMCDEISPDRIHVTGIPVDRVFENPPSRTMARHSLGLPSDGIFVLVVGGGNGLSITAEHVQAIERIPGIAGTLVITGCNRKLEREIAGLAPVSDKIRLVYSTVSEIERFYAAADILVSKPGGLTMSEATAMGMPIIMISPLPGQEVRNAEFLSRAGAAILAEDTPALSARLGELVGDGAKRSSVAEASYQVGRSDAARRIATVALNMSRSRVLQSV